LEVQNPGSEKPLLNLDCEIVSSLPGFEKVMVKRDTLGRNNNYVVLDRVYAIGEQGTYDMNITIAYESEFGERFVEVLDKRIEVGKTGASGTVEPGTEPGVNYTGQTDAPEKESKKKWDFELPSFPSLNELDQDQTRIAGVIIIASVMILGLILFYLKHRIQAY